MFVAWSRPSERCLAAGRSASTDPFGDATAVWVGLHGMVSLWSTMCDFPWPERHEFVRRLVLRLAKVEDTAGDGRGRRGPTRRRAQPRARTGSAFSTWLLGITGNGLPSADRSDAAGPTPSARAAHQEPPALGAGFDGAAERHRRRRHPAHAAAFWVAAVVAGVAAGLFGAFLMVILFSFHRAFGFRHRELPDGGRAGVDLRRVGSLVVAGAVGWYLVRHYLKDENAEIDRGLERQGKLSLRRGTLTSIISEAVIGMGASMGRRRGPS